MEISQESKNNDKSESWARKKEDNFEKIQGIMKINPLIASAVVVSTSGLDNFWPRFFTNKNSGQLLGGDKASLGPQDRFQRQKRIDDEVTVIDGNSIPESGVLR